MDLSFLNPAQLAAVKHTEGPLLVLAGAGSGKTRVITCRIAYLIRVKKVAPEHILAVTFTNKAAREMRERVGELVGRAALAGMTVSTFHALGAQLLREHIACLGYKKNFTIYDTADQLRLLRDLQKEEFGEQLVPADRVLWRISAAKGELRGSESITPRAGDVEGEVVARLFGRYQKALKACNAVDFDDLLWLTFRLFEEHPAVLETCRERFRYLLVDEYQDTNAAQYRLLQLLAGTRRNLCVVGDDDQSIYGWRGANLGNILEFEKDFPGTRVVKLEQNYRSTATILQAANTVIAKNRKRKAKALWTDGKTGEPVACRAYEDDLKEAEGVVEALLAERFAAGRPWRDFAILYRANAQSRPFEEQLRFASIPYVLIGGQQFFDRKEVKDALAYLRLIANPRDEASLLRVLNYPKRGIGETSAERLIQHSAATHRPLWEVLRHPPELGEGKVREALARFVALIERHRSLEQAGRALPDRVRALFAELGLEHEIARGTDDLAQARRRIENLGEVVNALAIYAERDPAPTLTGFLEKVTLLDEGDPGPDDKEKKLKQDAVTLMSLHSSKGLEFPVVFLVGFEDEYLPHQKSIEEGGDIEEERRLCYVGITRARERLVLTRASQRRKYGKLVPRLASRFLEEIPEELLRHEEGEPERTPEEQDAMADRFFASMRELLGKK